LVHAGESGSVFRARDPDALAAAIQPLVEQPALRRKLGEGARQLISRYDLASAADGIVAAATAVAQAPRRERPAC
jgi:glycosyltransferase involved in cell wall biosynthesis